MLRYISIIAGMLISGSLFGQIAVDVSVQINATVQTAPPAVALKWKPHGDATGYEIRRKAKNAVGWNSVTNLPGSASSYTDNTVVVDSAYEYFIIKRGGAREAAGYIYAGVRAPAIHARGTIMLLVDDRFTTSCAAELSTLMSDLRGDGWRVLRQDVPPSATDVSNRNLIIAAYNNHSDLKAVYIIGHVAVPYSGDINPDAHVDHKGAWPADLYYADVNDSWTDAAINNTTANKTANHNTPGDGKWDQSSLPGNAELQVGRIDFADMPAFAKTEEQLLKSYLNRAHQYKMNLLPVVKRGLVDDHFTSYAEGFAQNGWRNFAPLVGIDSVSARDFLSSVETQSYQWVYGCGAGSFTKATGIGSTQDIAGQDVNSIFTMLFGSYFGDWNTQNNFLRAPLCADVPALTSFWVGRPNAFFHHMALGEHIGYSVLLSQNNSSAYQPVGNFGTFVHQALMGDPSLRAEYVSPPGNVTLTSGPKLGAQMSWSASAEPGVVGYYIYQSDSEFGHYSLRSGLVTGTSYTDNFGTDGNYYYMVRAAKLQETPSGSYYNLSLGAVDDAYVSYPLGIYETAAAAMQLSLYPSPAKDKLHLNITHDKGGKFDIYIQDIYGRKIQRRTETLAAGSHKVMFDIKALPAGVYTISVQNDDGEIVRKWVKGE